MYQRAGYTPVTYDAVMVRPDLENIPDAPLPEGLGVRPAQPEQMRQIWEAEVEAFRDHWNYFAPTEEQYELEYLTFPYLDLSLWRVAWDGDEVAGMVRGFINTDENCEYNRRRGWCENISVRRPYRRRGLARALMALTLQEFKRRGMEESALGVHTQNPNGAFQLYQSMGFRVSQMHTVYRRPLG
jgi:ribosomal protein S18 acetylase RimI-like enzyme